MTPALHELLCESSEVLRALLLFIAQSFVDNEAESGESYYYARVIQVDGEIAWSSPIWVNRR